MAHNSRRALAIVETWVITLLSDTAFCNDYFASDFYASL